MTQSDTQTPLRLSGELTIYHAAEIKPQLVALIGRADTPDLDLSEVTELDTAGLQLLLFARREANAAGKPLRCLSPSPVVIDVLSLCNLTAKLGEPADAASNS